MSEINCNIVFQPFQKSNMPDIAGKTFSRWTVLGYAGKSRWFCRCQCGKVKAVYTQSIIQSRSKSCGCYSSEQKSKRQNVHGEIYSLEYRSYQHAKQRCTNKNYHQYFNYGGRGIEFRFKNFQEFIAEVGKKPTPKHSIDRIDNDGHYEKGNVCWATKIEQNRNTRKTVWLTYRGETKPITVWSEILGIPCHTIYTRMHRKHCAECVLIPVKFVRCKHK